MNYTHKNRNWHRPHLIIAVLNRISFHNFQINDILFTRGGSGIFSLKPKRIVNFKYGLNEKRLSFAYELYY